MIGKIVYGALLLVSLVGLLSTVLFSGAFQRDDIIKAFHVDNVAYQTSLRPTYVHRETTQSDLKELSVSMAFLAQSIHRFDDLFQTADGNSGLRLELSKPDTNTLALIAGAAVTQGYTPYVVTRKFALNQWHTFSLSVDRADHISVRFDGAAVVDETNPDLAFRISNVMVGTGLSGLRPFHGQIKNAAIAYTFLERRSNSALLLGLRIAFGLGVIIFALLLFAQRRSAHGTGAAIGCAEDSRNSPA